MNLPFQPNAIVPRWYQQEAVNSIFEYFENKDGNPVVALPTGTGKSVVIANFLQIVFQWYWNQRVMVLTHVKELIEQNADKMLKAWPHAPIGIYSAGLKQRQTMNPIIFGGAQSVVNCVEMFGHRDLIIIDEAHLVSPDAASRYQKIIGELKLINPRLKVVGLTATWYRMGQGLITQGGLFTDICYNLCDTNGFNRLIAEGFLCPPLPKTTRTELDVSDVGMSNGDFNMTQVQRAVDRNDINTACLSELCDTASSEGRRKMLVFCSGIEHAEHCADILQGWGVRAAAVHSKMKAGERDRIIEALRLGELDAVTNNNVLTTGFDDPEIDIIGMLRPTMSPGLWVQMIGRGTRPSPHTGKSNCRVLDFARNTLRLGPIDDPMIPRPKGEGSGEVPVKICPACGCYNHTRVRFCVECGEEFEFQQKLVRQSAAVPLLSGSMPQVERFKVDRVMYNRHVGRSSGVVNVKVSYLCGLRMFQEYISFDHQGYAQHRAKEWWRQRHPGEPPLSTDIALARLHELRTPTYIKVWVNKKNPEVMSYEY